MNIFFRIFLAVYAFCMAVVSFITMLITFNTSIYNEISDYITKDVLTSPNARFTMFLIAFIFFILSITFLLSGFKSKKDKKSVNKHTNVGEIKISLNSIESIALTASRKLNGVREAKAYVSKHEDSVSIVIKSVVMPDINIPALCEDIQIKVKNSVEECAGVAVDNVKVLIDNISTGYRSRVE
jgi:uncharacterized alkaline shock family protein YloU